VGTCQVAQCIRDNNLAAFECTSCHATLCPNCVRRSVGSQVIAMLCPKCGALVRQIAPGRAKGEPKTFWQYLLWAPIWPMYGRGLIVLHVNAFMLFGLLLALPLVALMFGWLMRMFALLVVLAIVAFALGYLALMFLETARATAGGEPHDVSTPTVTIRSTFGAFFRVLVVLVVWTIPAIAASNLIDGTPETWLHAGLLALANVGSLGHFAFGSDASLLVRLVAVGCALMVPISLLAVAYVESICGLNPAPLLVSVLRAPGQYLACCAAFYLVPYVLGLIFNYAARSTVLLFWQIGDIHSYAHLTILALVLLFISCLTTVYGMYLAGRILGAFGASNKERIGWE